MYMKWEIVLIVSFSMMAILFFYMLYSLKHDSDTWTDSHL